MAAGPQDGSDTALVECGQPGWPCVEADVKQWNCSKWQVSSVKMEEVDSAAAYREKAIDKKEDTSRSKVMSPSNYIMLYNKITIF